MSMTIPLDAPTAAPSCAAKEQGRPMLEFAHQANDRYYQRDDRGNEDHLPDAELRRGFAIVHSGLRDEHAGWAEPACAFRPPQIPQILAQLPS